MSNIERFYTHYDRNILVFIFTATFAVLLLVGVLMLVAAISSTWLFLPVSWWVGGMMVWGYGKYQRMTQ